MKVPFYITTDSQLIDKSDFMDPHLFEIHREYIHSVAVYEKNLTRLGELIILEPRLPNELAIFDIRLHYAPILFILNVRFVECNPARVAQW